MLVSKQVREKYLEDPGHCPCCGSDQINAKPHDNDSISRYYLWVDCDACGAEWTEEYHLRDITGVIQGDVPLPGTDELIAYEFSGNLINILTGFQMQELVERTKIDRQPGICHSHDYCDANIVMAGAFEAIVGRAPYYAPAGSSHEDSQTEDADTSLWNRAWTLAKDNNFFYSHPINPIPFNLQHTLK